MVTSEYIPIKPETVKAFADEARRLGETENELSTAEMLVIFGKAVSSNALALPGVPVEELKTCPYAFISKSTAQYNLVLSNAKYFFAPENGSKPDRLDTYATKGYNFRLTFENFEKGEDWSLRDTTLYYWQVTSPAIWSNYNIPNGSETATDIYFEKSKLLIQEE